MKRIILWVGIVVLILLVGVVALPFLIDANEFRPRLESELTKALGREVKVGNLTLAIMAGGVSADVLSGADDPGFSRSPFGSAKSLNVAVELWPLIFSRKLHVTGITIDQPQIVLLQNAPGDWNFSKLGAKPGAKGEPAPAAGGSEKSTLDLSVKLITITNGRVSVGKASGHTKPLVLEKVNLEVRDFSATSVMPFSLSATVAGGGDVQLSGKAGPINSDDMVLTPVDATLKVAHLDLAKTALMEPSSGIAGIVAIDRPLEVDFTIAHDLLKGSGTVSRGDVHIGKAVASVTGTYVRRGEAVILNAHLSGPSMPVEELEAMLPALNIVLPSGSSLQGGTAVAKVNVEGPIERLAAAGFLGLNNTRLTGFDLGSRMATIEKLAGIKGGPNTEIETLSANVKTGDDGTSIDDLKLIAPAIGELAGGGTINPEHALDFKMRVTLHTSGALMTALGQRGDTSVPFFVRGTSSAPKFEPDIKGMAKAEVDSLKGSASKAASGLLDGLLNRKKI